MAQISPSHPNPTHTHVRAWHDLLIYTSIIPVSHTYPIFCYIPDALFRASFIFQSRGIWSWLWNNTSSYHKTASIFQQCVLTIQFHNSFTSKLDHPPMSASWIKQRVSRCFEFDVVKLMSQIRTAVTIVLQKTRFGLDIHILLQESSTINFWLKSLYVFLNMLCQTAWMIQGVWLRESIDIAMIALKQFHVAKTYQSDWGMAAGTVFRWTTGAWASHSLWCSMATFLGRTLHSFHSFYSFHLHFVFCNSFHAPSFSLQWHRDVTMWWCDVCNVDTRSLRPC